MSCSDLVAVQMCNFHSHTSQELTPSNEARQNDCLLGHAAPLKLEDTDCRFREDSCQHYEAKMSVSIQQNIWHSIKEEAHPHT